jgi:hypothetical protein
VTGIGVNLKYYDTELLCIKKPQKHPVPLLYRLVYTKKAQGLPPNVCIYSSSSDHRGVPQPFIQAVPFFFESHGWCREERRRNCTVRFQEKGARVER